MSLNLKKTTRFLTMLFAASSLALTSMIADGKDSGLKIDSGDLEIASQLDVSEAQREAFVNAMATSREERRRLLKGRKTSELSETELEAFRSEWKIIKNNTKSQLKEILGKEQLAKYKELAKNRKKDGHKS